MGDKEISEVDDEETALAIIDERLRQRGLELRRESPPQALVNTHFDRWLEAAHWLSRGKPISVGMKKLGMAQGTIYKVQRQILDCIDDYRRWQVDNLEANLNAVDGISMELMNRWAESGLNISLDDAKTLKELQVSGQMMAQRSHRLQDGVDKVVRHEVNAADFDTMMKAAREARDKMKPAEPVDGEFIELEESESED